MYRNSNKPKIPSKNEILLEIQRAQIKFLKEKSGITDAEIEQSVRNLIGSEKYDQLLIFLAKKKPSKKPKIFLF